MEQRQSFDNFVNYIREAIPLYIDVRPEQISYRNSEELLVIEKPVSAGVGRQALRVRDIYGEYENGMELLEVLELVGETVRNGEQILKKSPLKHVEDFEAIKDSLIVRPLNYKRNKEALREFVYRRKDSIALAAYIAVGEMAGIFSSCKVSVTMAEGWNKSSEEVLEAALQNTLKLYPPRICSWRHLNRLSIESDFGDFMNPRKAFWLNSGPGGNLLTTVNKLNGAAAIFLPGVAKRLGDLMEEDYLVAFTSMHEAMIHNLHTASVKSIREVLDNMNKKIVSKEDFLTKDIYRYDRESDKLKIIT